MSRQLHKPRHCSLSLQPILRLGLLLAFALPLLSTAALMAQATNFEIGTTAQRSSVKHLGVNLAGDNFYDSGQMFRNLTFGNPGFEGETWQTIMQCVAVTAASRADSNIYNVWPANCIQGSSFQVISGTGAGVTGTITSSTAANFAGNTGLTFNFAATSTPLAVNNYLIVQMTAKLK